MTTLQATASRTRGWQRDALGAAVPVAVLVVLFVAVHQGDPYAVTSLGLISITPGWLFGAVAVLSVTFAWTLRRGSQHRFALALHILALVLAVHGLAAFLEQEPRFATAYLHLGFVRSILRTGQLATLLDARFSWPGFFTSMATAFGMAGPGSGFFILRVTPVVMNLMYLVPVYVIARAVLGSTRAWIVAWLFVLTNWVGQDYFSPQAIAYFLMLAMLAIVIIHFPAQGVPRIGRWLRADRLVTRVEKHLRPGPELVSRVAVSPVVGLQRVLLFVLIIATALAMAMSHQLTPIATFLDLVGLALIGATDLTTLPILLAVLVSSWLSFAAFDYWGGHLSAIFGAGGTGAVTSNVSGRLHGSLGHLAVVYVRVGFAVAVWLLAGIGAALSWVRRRGPGLMIIVAAAAPFVLILAQGYGGEAQLRLYAYTLPFMLILAVGGLFSARPGWLPLGGFAVCAAAMYPAFLIARFGNEQFEQVTRSELTAIAHVYSIAPPGAQLIGLTPDLPWGYRGFGIYTYAPGAGSSGALTSADAVLAQARQVQPAYLFITRDEEYYGEALLNLPRGWVASVEREIRGRPTFQLLYENHNSRIYRVTPR